MAPRNEVTGSDPGREICTDEERSTARLIALVLGLVTILAYLPVQFYDFAYYDDRDYVTQNPAVLGGLSWAGIRWAFTSFHASNWHPVTWLSHALDCELFGPNPGAQHLVNALLHSANAVLFLAFWYRTSRQLWPSALAAALFAWHPLRVESVAWIAERKDVLSTFFGLLTLWFYAGYAQNDRATNPPSMSRSRQRSLDYGLALLCYALGLMSKPMLVTWPCVLLLLDYWPLGRFRPGQDSNPAADIPRERRGRLVLEKVPFLVMAIPVCVLTVLAQKQNAILSLENCPPGLRLSNALMSYARYLIKVVWPVDLTISYPFPRQYPAWKLAAAAALLLAISAWAWRRRRRQPFWLMGWLWYLGTLVPVIGLVQAGSESMADRYTYIPVMGVAAALAFGAAEMVRNFAVPRVYITTVCSLALGALLCLTEYQLQFWQNPSLLFQHALAGNPNNRVAHQVLGSYLYDQGQPKRALEEFQAAVKSVDADLETSSERKFSIRAHQALAHDYQEHGMIRQALEEYRTLLRLAPESAEVHNDLANLLSDQGQRQDAIDQYREAIRLKPDSPLPHENLGNLFVEAGEFDAGIREISEAARLAPRDGRPRQLLAMAYLQQGDRAAAVVEFRQAIDLDSNDAQSMAYLARILAADEDPSIRNGAEAMRWSGRAMELSVGRQPFVLDTLAMAYAERGQFAEARKITQTALQLERAAGHASAVSNLQSRLGLYELDKPYREKFRLESSPRNRPGTAREHPTSELQSGLSTPIESGAGTPK